MKGINRHEEYSAEQEVFATRSHDKIVCGQLYRQVRDVQHVCRRYHISRVSLKRWNRQYDGTRIAGAEVAPA